MEGNGLKESMKTEWTANKKHWVFYIETEIKKNFVYLIK